MNIKSTFRKEVPESGTLEIEVNALGLSRLELYGDGTLSADVSIQASTDIEVKNLQQEVLWNGADVDLNGNDLTIFGVLLTAKQLSKKTLFVFEYDGTNWDIYFLTKYDSSTFTLEENSVVTKTIADANVTTAKLVNNAITFAKIQRLGTNDVIVGKGASADVEALSIPSAKILIGDTAALKAVYVTGAVTMDKNGVTTMNVTPVEGLYRRVSLNSGYLGDVKMIVPFDCIVKRITAHVDQLIEATDDATIVVKNNAGTSMGSLGIVKNSAIGVGFNLSPSANNEFAAGQTIAFATSKTTPGGEVFLSIEVQRVNFNSFS